MAATDSSEPVSPSTATTVEPVAAANSAAVTSSASRPRAATATAHPSSARALATALPIPRLPPVTNARFPASCRSMCAMLAQPARRGNGRLPTTAATRGDE